MNHTNDIQKYMDIIDLPHHTSANRARMPVSDRAAQFSPFSALNGYEAVIRETERLTGERIELDESSKSALDEKLRIIMEQVNEKPEITITYFRPDDRKAGGAYVTVTGCVKKIDAYERAVVLADGTRIRMEDILELSGEVFRGVKKDQEY